MGGGRMHTGKGRHNMVWRGKEKAIKPVDRRRTEKKQGKEGEFLLPLKKKRFCRKCGKNGV